LIIIHVYIAKIDLILFFLLGRRWRKTSTSFSRKKKDTINLASVTINNANKNILISDVNDDSVNNIDNNFEAIKTVSDIDHDKIPYVF